MHLYRFYDADDVLLYVGITANPDNRFKEHARTQTWWPQVASRLVEVVSDDQARLLERRAIYDEEPLYNTIGIRRVYDKKPALDSWGDNIATARAAAGWTQQDLARRIGGLSANSVARWEQGVRRPLLREQRRIARILNVSITSLFPRSEDERELAATVAAALKAAS